MPYSNIYPCQVEGCTTPKRYKLYCTAHHVRWKKWGDPLGKAPQSNNLKHTHCTIEGCDKKHTALGMCQMHYRRNALYGDRSDFISERALERNLAELGGKAGFAEGRAKIKNGK